MDNSIMEDFLITGNDLLTKNKEKIWIDEKAKSLSYFSTIKPAVVDTSIISSLEEISSQNNNANVRLCLHTSPQETLHHMIILEYKDKKCRMPHKHLDKDEVIQIIKGEMLALLFDDSGNVNAEYLLSKDNNFIFKSAPMQYHFYIPVSDRVIYSEAKQGPFKRQDNIPADFNYQKILRQYFKEHHKDYDFDCNNSLCKTPCSLNKLK